MWEDKVLVRKKCQSKIDFLIFFSRLSLIFYIDIDIDLVKIN